MNWIPLRKNNVPIVDRQIQSAISVFQKLRKQILEGDILSVQKLSELQISIQKRIHEIDEFYNKNCLDERIRFLQKGRMALALVIQQNSNMQLQKQSSQGFPWKLETDRLSEQSTFRQKFTISPKSMKSMKSAKKDKTTKVKNISNLSEKPVKQSIKENKKVEPKKLEDRKLEKYLQPEKKQEITTKTPPKPPKVSKKVERIPEKLQKKSIEELNLKSQRTKRVTGQKSQRESDVSSMKKLSELIFTIKMTKEEYNDFMDMKEKMEYNL